MSVFRLAIAPLVLAVFFLGCAEGGDGRGVPPRDSGIRLDTGRTVTDSGTTSDSGMTMGDSGGTECPAGRHACGTGCVDDLENLPANGCRLGCGEPCPVPPDGAASCNAAGRCTVAACTPRTCADAGAMCGTPDNGCGTPLDCGTCPGGGACTDGTCAGAACTPDTGEANDARFMAPNIASMTDAPDSNEVFSAYNIHAMDDEDWFEISVADDLDLGNPQITVDLRNIPAGDDYDLAAYYVCDSGGDDSSCDRGTSDNSIGRGCTSTTTGNESVQIATECSGTDEGGALIIHITANTFTGACGAYELEVDIH